jgi:hypothetical protein
MTNVSPVEKGRINKANYVAYVAELKATGKKFPLNQFGEVNLSGIAKACGFLRGVFTTNKSLKQLLDSDILIIGTEIKDGAELDTRLSQKAEEKSKEASKLHKDLDAKVQEVNSLREQIDELKKCIRELESRSNETALSMDELLDSGRRFTL